jgi:hypothetical protein
MRFTDGKSIAWLKPGQLAVRFEGFFGPFEKP